MVGVVEQLNFVFLTAWVEGIHAIADFGGIVYYHPYQEHLARLLARSEVFHGLTYEAVGFFYSVFSREAESVVMNVAYAVSRDRPGVFGPPAIVAVAMAAYPHPNYYFAAQSLGQFRFFVQLTPIGHRPTLPVNMIPIDVQYESIYPGCRRPFHNG